MDNTISRGEQTGKTAGSLIRRRFVPALTGKLTVDGANVTELVKAIKKNQQFHELEVCPQVGPDHCPAKVNDDPGPAKAKQELGQFSDSACGETYRQKIHI
ncbi:hypothetical protein [Mesorhizobium sp. WSM4313]|uniref:hypothetical protein n=1 Tax=Mesorhizobium sp. WSM4313 TaxID=2029412 RepID=UPI0011409DCD|nr:hypothetical protein [Mesorhizobium sp. WSM4313]